MAYFPFHYPANAKVFLPGLVNCVPPYPQLNRPTNRDAKSVLLKL